MTLFLKTFWSSVGGAKQSDSPVFKYKCHWVGLDRVGLIKLFYFCSPFHNILTIGGGVWVLIVLPGRRCIGGGSDPSYIADIPDVSIICCIFYYLNEFERETLYKFNDKFWNWLDDLMHLKSVIFIFFFWWGLYNILYSDCCMWQYLSLGRGRCIVIQ